MKHFLLKSLLAIAVLCVGSSSVWADDEYVAVYTRAAANDWTADDLTGWGGAANLGKNETNGLGFDVNLNSTSSGISASKSFAISANAKIKYEFDWYFGSSLGNAGNYAFVRFGNFIIRWYNNGYSTSFSVDGTNFTTFSAGCTSNTTWTKAVEVIINTAENSIEKFAFGGTDFTSNVTSDPTGTFSDVSFGFVRGGRGGNWPVPCFLKTFKVSQCEQAVTNVGYTINYKLDNNVVKTVEGTNIVGNTITALTAIDGEGDYAGNHYLITAAEAPSMELVADAASNVLNVPVRAPYTATLRVTTTIGGTPSVVDTPLTETDGKVCNWSFAYPKYAAKDGIYYLCDASTFVQSGTFSDDEIVERTVTYTTPDVSIVGFSEIGSGTNGAYSNGGYTVTNSQLATATVDAGNYIAYISVIGKGGSGSNYRQEGVVVGGEQVANTAGNTTGLKSLSFTVSENNTEVYVKGNGSSNYTDELDYVLIRRGDIAAGTYYLKNKATGAYFAAGLNYGTKAMTNTIGHTVTLSQQSLGYNIDTKISNGGDNHYLNGVWTDGAASVWDFLSDGDGYYAINNGTGNLTSGAVGAEISIALSVSDNAKWQLLTESEWKAEQVERLDAATASNGVDATFYIPAANFNRNDNTENNKWQGSPAINGLSENSAATNYNAEKFNTTFDVYQELTGLKPGAYKLTIQGFYRNGTTNDRNAILYANSFETPLVSIRTSGATEADASKGLGTDNDGIYVPNGQSDAAKAFNAGLYNNELYFVVGEGGTLRVGVKKTVEATNDWAVFDNFQLTYYGTTIPVTLGSLGWATLYTPYALDFDGTGLTAYTATVVDEKVTLNEVSNVPANTGVVLNGAAGSSYNIPTTASSETPKGALTGNATESTAYNAVAGHTYYVLASSEDANFKVQFRPVTSGSIAAGKAFLDVAGGGVKAFNVVFNDLATGINELANGQQPMANGPIFNLAGQRMSKLQRGVNIVNGKKVLVK